MGEHNGRDTANTPRRLMLLRHAKSDWPEGVEDHNRPLSRRGRKAASLIADYLVKKRLRPDLALVSSARRARETLSLIEAYLPKAAEIRIIEALYDAPAEQILDVLRGLGPDCRSVLVLAHNPGIQEVALWLADGGEGDALARLRDKFPTAGLACILLNAATWQDVDRGCGYLERFVVPRSLA